MTALSAWWADTHHRSLARHPVGDHGSSDAMRLAIALQAVRAVVRVIDSSRPRLTVLWADMNKSYTDFATGEIRLNPAPIIDRKVDNGAGLDTVIAFGVHEAGHGEESRGRYEALNGSEYHDNRVAHYLLNLVEDTRSENETRRKWPGFGRYLDWLLDWLWDHTHDRHPYDYSGTLEQKLMFAFTVCRFPDRALIMGSFDERDWWQAWQADYIAGADTIDTIKRALDHLAETVPEGTVLSATMADGCMIEVEASESMLGRQLAESVDRLVEEELEHHDPIIRDSNGANPDIFVSRPIERGDEPPVTIDTNSAALRAALVFKPSAAQWDEKLLKAGELDETELYRWASGDYRVFSQRTIEDKPDVAMGLLVDLSGSMVGSGKLDTARRLALLFVYALHDQEGVSTTVWGHTAEAMGTASADIYRLWEQGDPISRLGLIETLPHVQNADGHAIAWCVDQLAHRDEPEKVLIVLSDGLPQMTHYGGAPARAHMREVCRWAMSRGVRVIQIAIDPIGLRPAEQEAMFGPGNWVGYESDEALPRQLASIMGSYR